MDTGERGRTAERLARDLLVEHGLEALGTNWRRRLGEIDLIMREPSDGTTVFVEVRYRAHASLGGGLESVDAGKRARLRRAALAWLQRHGDPDAPARIDVVAIGPAESSAGSPDATVRRADPGRDGEPADGTAGLDRIVARRDGQLIEWVVSAVEDD